MEKRYHKIILAGEDNICESIMAEAILKNVAADRPLEIISRGLVVLFPEPVNPKVLEVLGANHLKASKSYSEELTINDITEQTLILTLKESQAQKIVATMDPACDVATLRGFVGYKGDPVTPSGDMSNYQAAFEHLDLLVKAAAQIIFEPIDEEVAREPKPLSMEDVAKVVQQVFEESVQETLGADAVTVEAAAEKMKIQQKIQHEKELEEEYRRVVEKTAAREAAREAAKEVERSEYKLLYEEIRAKNKKSENNNGDIHHEDDSDIDLD